MADDTFIFIPKGAPYIDTGVSPSVTYQDGQIHAFDSAVSDELAAAGRIQTAGAGVDVSTLLALRWPGPPWGAGRQLALASARQARRQRFMWRGKFEAETLTTRGATNPTVLVVLFEVVSGIYRAAWSLSARRSTIASRSTIVLTP